MDTLSFVEGMLRYSVTSCPSRTAAAASLTVIQYQSATTNNLTDSNRGSWQTKFLVSVVCRNTATNGKIHAPPFSSAGGHKQQRGKKQNNETQSERNRKTTIILQYIFSQHIYK